MMLGAILFCCVVAVILGVMVIKALYLEERVERLERERYPATSADDPALLYPETAAEVNEYLASLEATVEEKPEGNDAA